MSRPHTTPHARPGPNTSLLNDRVRRHVRSHPVLRAGDSLVVAVSGGIDSTVLLDVLSRATEMKLVVAHLDHGLRGDASRDDARFVREMAAERGLAFIEDHVDVGAAAAREKLSLEDAARRERRTFLERVQRDCSAAAIALGHSRDDQAETLLLNLFRGAGPRGLAGMPEFGPGALTRPLLGSSRVEIEAYAAEANLSYREDATNRDTDLTRNWIRHDLLPRIAERVNPNVAGTLARQAELFGDIETFLDQESDRWLEDASMATLSAQSIRLSIEPMRRLPPALRRSLLRRAARRVAGNLSDWTRTHIDKLEALTENPGNRRLDLPGNVVASCSRDDLRLALASRAAPDETIPAAPVPLEHGSEVRFGKCFLRIAVLKPAGFSGAVPRRTGPRSASFDADRLAAIAPDGALVLRPWRSGDRIRPFGLDGTRKVGDVFTDRKIGHAVRTRRPLLTAGNDPDAAVLWIPGLIRSDAAPVTPDTASLLVLDWFGDPQTTL